MYRVYADDVCIYNDISSDEGAKLISPVLEFSDNASGSFTFTMPVVNAGYETLKLMSSKIRVIRNDTEIWEGRAIKEAKDFWKNRQITCEGALGYLNDVIQPQRMMPDDDEYRDFEATPREFLQIILDYHNSQMRAIGRTDRIFRVGDVTVTDKMKNEDTDGEYDESLGASPTIYTDFKNTLECISEKLISGKNQNGDDLEGHIRVRKVNGEFFVDYLKDPIQTSDQIIEFGNNLLDFTVNYDESEFCTVLYPRGASDGESVGNLQAHKELLPEQNGQRTKDGMTFQVTAPRVIYTAGVNQFGWIERVLDQSDITDEDKLLNKTLEWFVNNRFNDMEIEIKAFDLAYLGVDASFINYMENVEVRSVPHGLDKLFPVLNISIPLDNPSNATYTLGKKKVQSLSTYSSTADDRITYYEEYSSKKTNSAMKKALDESGNMIRTATTGNVNILQTAYGAKALVVSNLTDNQIEYMRKNNKTIDEYYNPMWVWNLKGLGFFPTGLNSTPTIAMTYDGKLNASMIKTGELSADRISGGTLTLTSSMKITTGYDWGTKIEMSQGVIKGLFNNTQYATINMSNGWVDLEKYRESYGYSMPGTSGYKSGDLFDLVQSETDTQVQCAQYRFNGYSWVYQTQVTLTKHVGLRINGDGIGLGGRVYSKNLDPNDSVSEFYRTLPYGYIRICYKVEEQSDGSIRWYYAYVNISNGMITDARPIWENSSEMEPGFYWETMPSS